MLSEAARARVERFGPLKHPVRMILFTSDAGCDACPAMTELARAIKAREKLVALEIYDKVMDRDKTELYGITHAPALAVQDAAGRSVVFYGKLDDACLELFLIALAGASESRVWFPENVVRTLSHLTNDVSVRVFVDRDCKACLPVAETAIGLGLTNDMISTSIFVSRDFPELVKRHHITELPKTIFGENLHLDGHASESVFLEMIFQAEGVKAGPDKRCLVCGAATPDVICAACKSKIQAEAVEHKLKGERMKPK